MQGWSAASFISLLLLQGAASPEPRPLQDVLAAVSRNVTESRDLLPDFVCNERVTSTTYRSGKQSEQKVVESIYSVQQSITVNQAREHREILTIDGKPAKKGAKMPGLPVNIAGSFNYMINAAFTSDFLQFYDFEMAQPPVQGGRHLVRFETKKDQKKMIWNIDGNQRAAHDSGLAWIDPSSMQVARMERNLLNLIKDIAIWKITIDQVPITIGEKQFWLPKAFLTDITFRDARNTGTFLAEYTNCKKFTTEVTIRPQ